MKVKATARGEYPVGTWRKVGEVFDYDGPAKVPAYVKNPDGSWSAKGTRDGFPKWMEKVSASKAKAEAQAGEADS